METQPRSSSNRASRSSSLHRAEASTDEERALLPSPNGDETELQTRASSASHNSRHFSVPSKIKRKTSQILDAVRGHGEDNENARIPEMLAELVSLYESSSTGKAMQGDFDAVHLAHTSSDHTPSTPSNGTVDPSGARADMREMRDVAAETSMLRGRQRASWGTQFRILSGRAFKNLYRDPALLTAHYTSSVALARKSCFHMSVALFSSGPSHIAHSHLRIVLPPCQQRYCWVPESPWHFLLYTCPLWFLLPFEPRPVCKREDFIHARTVSVFRWRTDPRNVLIRTLALTDTIRPLLTSPQR